MEMINFLWFLECLERWISSAYSHQITNEQAACIDLVEKFLIRKTIDELSLVCTLYENCFHQYLWKY